MPTTTPITGEDGRPINNDSRRHHQTIPTLGRRRGRKIFCPRDGRALVWNPDTQRFFCQACQFGVKPEVKKGEESPYAQSIIVTMDGHDSRTAKGGRRSEASGAMKMKFRPVRAVMRDNAKRFPYRNTDKDFYDSDPDLRRIIKAGGNIVSVKDDSYSVS